MLACGKPRFSAGRIDRRIRNGIVPLRGNGLLRSQDRFAYLAMLACGKPRFGAGRIDRRIRNRIVPQRGNGLLRSQDRFAYLAMLACGKPRFGAGRIDRRIRNRIVPQRFQHGRFGQLSFAAVAIAAPHVSVLRAGRFQSLDRLFIVSQRFQRFSADGASSALRAGGQVRIARMIAFFGAIFALAVFPCMRSALYLRIDECLTPRCPAAVIAVTKHQKVVHFICAVGSL